MGAVARELGKNRNTISAWETGRTMPSAGDLSELVALYRCSADWLLGSDLATGFAALVDQKMVRLLADCCDLETYRARLPSLALIVHAELRLQTDPSAFARVVDEALDRLRRLQEKASR